LTLADLNEVEEDIGEDQGIGHPGSIFGRVIVTDGNDHDGFLGASEKKILERCEIHGVSISLERRTIQGVAEWCVWNNQVESQGNSLALGN
jgi:hypothetical protein